MAFEAFRVMRQDDVDPDAAHAVSPFMSQADAIARAEELAAENPEACYAVVELVYRRFFGKRSET